MLNLSFSSKNIKIAFVLIGGSIVVTTITILPSLEDGIQNLVLIIGISIGVMLSVVIPLLIFLYEYRTRPSVHVATIPYSTEREKDYIQRNIPKIWGEARIRGIPVIGYNALIKLNVHNTTPIILDDLDAMVETTDLKLSRTRTPLYKDIADIRPNTDYSSEFTIKLGRFHKRYRIIVKIRRKNLEIGNLYFTFSS